MARASMPVKSGPRSPLVASVAPGEILEQELQISWPSRTGGYRLVVDLLLEEVAWFSDRTGAPLAEVDLEIAGEVDDG